MISALYNMPVPDIFRRRIQDNIRFNQFVNCSYQLIRSIYNDVLL